MPLEMLNNDPWYKNGLKFKCTGCGQCCTGSPGYIWFTHEEGKNIADSLGISIEDFYLLYSRRINDRYSLREIQGSYDCIFLKNKKCTIYNVRPKQCRTYPWWLSNLKSKKAWNEAAKYCEGINHPEATLVSINTIQEELDSDV